jgi:hypothetical protein
MAVTGCTAWALRMLRSLASDRPKWRTFPGVDQVFHRPGDLLHGYGRIHAVLVEQVDVIGTSVLAAFFPLVGSCGPACDLVEGVLVG